MRAERVLSSPWLPVAVGLLAAAPVILAAIRFLAGDWTPVGDDAVIAARSYDVLTFDTPLLGQYSSSSQILGIETHSPGPMLYWLLALPARFGAPESITVTVCLVNTAAIVGTVVLARRRGGNALMFLTAVAVVVMSTSLVSKTWADIWNPAITILPFMLFVFTAWSIACGEYKLLPLAALVGSFIVQGHLTFVVPVAGLSAIAAVGLWRGRRHLDRSGLRRAALIAAAITAVCWSVPVLEQAIHRPGNVVSIYRLATADVPKTGFSNIGRDTFVHTAGIPPWWAQVADEQYPQLADLLRPVGIAKILSALAVLAALIALVVVAERRGRRDVSAAAASSLLMLAAVTWIASSTPVVGLSFISLGYTIWWSSVASMFTWLVLIWGTAQLVARDGLSAATRGRASAALVGAGAVIAIVTLVRWGAGPDNQEKTYAPMRQVERRLERMVRSGEKVRVDIVGRDIKVDDHPIDYQAGAVYALRRQGAKPLVLDASTLGGGYDGYRKAIDRRLVIAREGEAEDQVRGAREVARVPDSKGRTIVIWLAPPR